MERVCLGIVISTVAVFAQGARGQFVPGHVFVSDPAKEFCAHGGTTYWDRIWEVDPDTGDVTLFAEFFADECQFITGLAFTPDGCALRASAMLTHSILEFDAQGNVSVVLDADDGISWPWGSNNITYDVDGNFYVVNAGLNIMRFPAHGGPGTVIANRADGVLGEGPIVVASNGDVYFGNQELERYVLRMTPGGDVSRFDAYPIVNIPWTLSADEAGTLFVGLGWDGGGIWRYRAGEALSAQVLSSDASLRSAYTMTSASHQQDVLYVGTFRPPRVATIRLRDGKVTVLAEFTGDAVPASGIAVAALLPGDVDRDGDTDAGDHALFTTCMSAPDKGAPDPSMACSRADLDGDGDIDLKDFSRLQRGFGAALPACK